MNFSPELIIEVVLALGTGFGVYAAIRADLARLHERTAMALEGVKTAHQRIDQHFSQQGVKP